MKITLDLDPLAIKTLQIALAALSDMINVTAATINNQVQAYVALEKELNERPENLS